MPEHLPEAATVWVAGPDGGTMSFIEFGTNIPIAVNQDACGLFDTAPLSLIYSTDTAAVTAGLRLPHDHICDLDDAMAAGGKLYAWSWVFNKHTKSSSDHLQVLASTNLEDLWDPSLRWSWCSSSTPPLVDSEEKITCHTVHPDGRTIFISTDWKRTFSFDTGNGEWKELGDWVLPFKGQAYFDRDLDAWVGLHCRDNGYVCLCLVASCSTATAAGARSLECMVLEEKLGRYREDDPKNNCSMWSRTKKKATTLAYMGDGRFCLVENIPCGEHVYRNGSMVHVTLFGLKYDHNGEPRTKAHLTTRSYAVSENATRFSHAIFWI